MPKNVLTKIEVQTCVYVCERDGWKQTQQLKERDGKKWGGEAA